jgi:hypothetical protein
VPLPDLYVRPDDVEVRLEKLKLEKSVDLSALRRIFPDTSDFMRDALYAHLVAFNYIVKLREEGSLSLEQRIPSKAARILNINQDAEGGAGYDEDAIAELQMIERGLGGVVTKLIDGMAGRSSNLDGGEGINQAFVAALAEVVRKCED